MSDSIPHSLCPLRIFQIRDKNVLNLFNFLGLSCLDCREHCNPSHTYG